jgi:hypothetical protein
MINIFIFVLILSSQQKKKKVSSKFSSDFAFLSPSSSSFLTFYPKKKVFNVSILIRGEIEGQSRVMFVIKTLLLFFLSS